MTMRFRPLIPLLLLGVLPALAGCGGGDTPAGGGETSTGGGGETRVGFYGDLTGSTATFGTSAFDGIRLARDEINRKPPLGKPIKVMEADTQGKPETAASVVTKLLEQDGVVAVLGEVASTRSLAAAPKCQKAGVPMISPASTNPEVTKIGKYIFRICFIDTFQGGVMAKFAYNTLKARNAAILTDVKNDYSQGLARFFKQTFTQLGGKVVSEPSYSEGDSDFFAQLNVIKQAKPDVIFVPGYYTEVGTIARQARDQGIRQPFLGGDGWDSPKLFEGAGDALEGAYFSNHYSVDNKDPRVQDFIKAFQAKFDGRKPDAMAALSYDAARILADAIQRAGSTKGDALQKALAETRDFPGVTGDITIDAERNAKKAAVVLQIQGKNYKYIETVKP